MIARKPPLVPVGPCMQLTFTHASPVNIVFTGNKTVHCVGTEDHRIVPRKLIADTDAVLVALGISLVVIATEYCVGNGPGVTEDSSATSIVRDVAAMASSGFQILVQELSQLPAQFQSTVRLRSPKLFEDRFNAPPARSSEGKLLWRSLALIGRAKAAQISPIGTVHRIIFSLRLLSPMALRSG